MDAVEFLKEKSRMCNTFNLCDGGGYKETCELYKEGLTCADYTNDYPEKAVEIVERWAKEHPKKTRQSKFLKVFPAAKVDIDNVPVICPKDLHIDFRCCVNPGERTYGQCRNCRKKYWLEEVEE